MRWTIGLSDGKITFEGSPPCGHMVVSHEFDPADFERARAFASEWMLSDQSNVILFHKSWALPAEHGFDEDFSPSDWMLQLCARAV